MKKKVWICCVLVLSFLLLTSCGKSDEHDTSDNPSISSGENNNASQSSVFQGSSQGINSDTFDPSDIPMGDGSGINFDITPGFFDDIDDNSLQIIDEEGEYENPTGESTDDEVPDDERMQATSLVVSWVAKIPSISVDLFKRTPDELKSMLKDQYPLSLRYVWGAPQSKNEETIGGYQDVWSCSSSDGSFNGKIYVVYDSKNDTQAIVVSAYTEVFVDTNGIITPVAVQEATNTLTEEPSEFVTAIEDISDSGRGNGDGLTLATVWGYLTDAVVTPGWDNILSGLDYEDLIMSFGKPHHRNSEGYYCWEVDGGYVCISFGSDAKYASSRAEYS